MTVMAEHPKGDANPTRDRLVFIDIARGLALLGMVAFHVDWDLAYWGWRDAGPAGSPAVMAFGHMVAGAFLFISGACLVLAAGRGTAAALRRISLLAGAALLITLTTFWLFPGEFIFFGILHCIAVSNLIGLAFIEAPIWITLLTGSLAAVAPGLLSSSAFDAPVWAWVGLATSKAPPTLDYRPLLPWLAAVLFGIAAARLVRYVPDVRPRARWPRGLAWAGRHSLAVYVAHQPLLFGLFALASLLLPGRAVDEERAFGRECLSQCMAAEAGRAGCEAACGCVYRRLHLGAGHRAASATPSKGELQSASELCAQAEPSKP